MDELEKELKNNLVEVRKAYRLLYDYQKKVLDLVNFIGSQFNRSYNGGYSKFSNSSPRNGKGNLNSWAWDWLNMYFYAFNFHELSDNNKSYFSIILLSDTGFYEGENHNNKLDLNKLDLDKLDLDKYRDVEDSSTSLYFVLGDNMWDWEKFFKKKWEDPDFLLKESGFTETQDKSGKMIFKRYHLEEFYSQENTRKKLQDFSSFCDEKGFDFKLQENIETSEK